MSEERANIITHNNKLVSVIVLSYNQKEYLKGCINSIITQSFASIEVIIIDNNSNDGSKDFINKAYPELRLIQNYTNEGYAWAHNQGIRASGGKYILPLNVDIVLDKNFIEEMVKAIEDEKKIGMVQAKLYQLGKEKIFDSTGIFIRKNRRNFDRSLGKMDNGQYGAQEYIFGASGAVPLYRRGMLEEIKIGGEYFDEDFFAYREEVDLAWRAQLLGWKCIYVPNAVAYHYRNYSPDRRKQMPRRLRQLQYRNRYLMIIKNELPATFIVHLHHILIFEILSFLYVLFREPFLLRAWPEIFRLLPKMLRKRKLIMRKKRVSASYILSLIK